MTSVPILKNLWCFCHLWYSFCYWQKCPEYVGLLFCSSNMLWNICLCGIYITVSLLPNQTLQNIKKSGKTHLVSSSIPIPARRWLEKLPRCPRETLPHLTSVTLMDIFPGCVKVMVGGLGDWEAFFPIVTDEIFLKCQKSSGFHSEILAMRNLPRPNHMVPDWKVLDYSLTME